METLKLFPHLGDSNSPHILSKRIGTITTAPQSCQDCTQSLYSNASVDSMHWGWGSSAHLGSGGIVTDGLDSTGKDASQHTQHSWETHCRCTPLSWNSYKNFNNLSPEKCELFLIFFETMALKSGQTVHFLILVPRTFLVYINYRIPLQSFSEIGLKVKSWKARTPFELFPRYIPK